MTHPRMNRRALGTLLSVLLLGTVLLAAAALVVVPRLTGSVPLTVLTGSMTPTYPPGTVVVVRPTPFDEIRVGDPVTYQVRSGDPTVVTHRVVSMAFAADGSRRLVTQGDANGAPDREPVRAVQVRGTVWYSVPYVGYVATALDADLRDQAVKGLAFALLGYGALLFLGSLRDRRHKRPHPA